MSKWGNGYNDFVNNCELSDYENVTISTDNNNPTSMPYDGVLTVYRPYESGWGFSITINGVNFMLNINADYACPLEFTIKKNDLVSCSATGGRPITTYARYYKKRDYSNR